MSEVFIEGMLLQASLILAVGPQNLFVLESGLKRHYRLIVSLICFLCDLALIMLGVAGAASFFTGYPQIKIIVGIAGVGFLVSYGISKLRFSEQELLELQHRGVRSCFSAAVVSAFTFSLLNPHAYLDGIVLIGGYSTKYSALDHRLVLGLGAGFFSLLWFLLLSSGGALLIPLFQNPKRMRILMTGAGFLLLLLSAKLSQEVYGWVEELYPESITFIGKGWQ